MKSFQVIRNADYRVLKKFNDMLDGLAALCSFVLVGAYLQLIVSLGDRKKKSDAISGALETLFQNKVLLFFHAVYFVIQLPIKKKLKVILQYKERSSIALFVQCVTKAWTTVREWGGLGSWKIVAQRYFYYN